MENKSKILAEIKKSKRFKIVVADTTYNGREYIDLRSFSLNDKNEFVPTRQGFTLTHDAFPEFAKKIIEIYNKDYKPTPLDK